MISSSSNPRIKNLKKLMNSARYRKEKNCFPVEGPRMFFEIPRDRILECYMTEAFEKKYRDKIDHISYELVGESLMRSLSDTRTPQGVIALVSREEIRLEDLLSSENPSCFLVVENLQDPGNLGTMIRTGEGAGITGLILDRQSVDPYHLKVIRSTMGAIFRLPIVIAEDLPRACRQLKQAGVTLYAGHLEGEPLYRTDLTGSCAFLIGNEGKGLTSGIMEETDRGIRIPMKGQLESLNAAVASTVFMYEVLRQRDWK